MASRKSSAGRVLPMGVSERKDGRFIYRYQVRGKTHYLYDRDLNDLKKKILQLQIDVASGINTEVGKLTLGEWYTQYIDIYIKKRVRSSTLFNYISYYNWYVKDSVIDRMPIKDLTHTHIVVHLQSLADKKHLSKGTLASLASRINGCLDKAVQDGVIRINPAKGVMSDVVAPPADAKWALSEEEVGLMIEYMKLDGWQNIYLPAIAIALSTGMRFGELFGLTWKDIDFKNNKIDINHVINYRTKVDTGKHEYFISKPKTISSYRKIPMSEEVKSLFIMQKNYQKSMRIRQDIKIDGLSGFVFTTKTGLPFTHEAITRTVRTIIKRANEMEWQRAQEEGREPVCIRDHTPHIWRHTLITRLIEKGVSCEAIKDMVGHKNIRVLLDIYNHATEKKLIMMKEELDDKISLL